MRALPASPASGAGTSARRRFAQPRARVPAAAAPPTLAAPMTTKPPARHVPPVQTFRSNARWLLVPLALCLPALAPVPATEPPYDLLLVGGAVIDGTGAPWFAADVGVRDGRIVAVGALAGHDSKRTIDA